MVMAMEGKLSKQQLAKVAQEKMRLAGKSAKRRDGVVGEGTLSAAGDGGDGVDDEEEAEPKSEEQVHAYTHFMLYSHTAPYTEPHSTASKQPTNTL